MRGLLYLELHGQRRRLRRESGHRNRLGLSSSASFPLGRELLNDAFVSTLLRVHDESTQNDGDNHRNSNCDKRGGYRDVEATIAPRRRFGRLCGDLLVVVGDNGVRDRDVDLHSVVFKGFLVESTLGVHQDGKLVLTRGNSRDIQPLTIQIVACQSRTDEVFNGCAHKARVQGSLL